MAFNDCFYFIGIALLISAVTLLFFCKKAFGRSGGSLKKCYRTGIINAGREITTKTRRPAARALKSIIFD
jgi:hypothetical protein